MHRTIGDGYIVDPTTGHNIYADEDLGTGRDATQVRHEEINALQEEIANVVEFAGYTLNSSSENIDQMVQLRRGVEKITENRIRDHVHDDFSINPSKIDLASHVTGLLPLVNIEPFLWEDDSTMAVVSEGGGVTLSYRNAMATKQNYGSNSFQQISFHLYVTPSVATKWLRFELPATFRPFGTYWEDFKISRVAAIRDNGGVLTDLDVYAKIFYDAGAVKTYVYIGNNELMNGVPSVGDFAYSGSLYNISGNLICKSYS